MVREEKGRTGIWACSVVASVVFAASRDCAEIWIWILVADLLDWQPHIVWQGAMPGDRECRRQDGL